MLLVKSEERDIGCHVAYRRFEAVDKASNCALCGYATLSVWHVGRGGDKAREKGICALDFAPRKECCWVGERREVGKGETCNLKATGGGFTGEDGREGEQELLLAQPVQEESAPHIEARLER